MEVGSWWQACFCGGLPRFSRTRLGGAPSALSLPVASRIEDMTPPPLRLILALPAPVPPVRPRVEPAPALRYSDFLRRENAIEHQVSRPRTPYSDYLASLPPRPSPALTAAPTDPPRARDASANDRNQPTCPPPNRAPRLADVPPLPAIRRELEVRTTYRVEVPLTSGRLVDVVM